VPKRDVSARREVLLNAVIHGRINFYMKVWKSTKL